MPQTNQNGCYYEPRHLKKRKNEHILHSLEHFLRENGFVENKTYFYSLDIWLTIEEILEDFYELLFINEISKKIIISESNET